MRKILSTAWDRRDRRDKPMHTQKEESLPGDTTSILVIFQWIRTGTGQARPEITAVMQFHSTTTKKPWNPKSRTLTMNALNVNNRRPFQTASLPSDPIYFVRSSSSESQRWMRCPRQCNEISITSVIICYLITSEGMTINVEPKRKKRNEEQINVQQFRRYYMLFVFVGAGAMCNAPWTNRW